MGKPKLGCCRDKSCTPDTCMRLPVIEDTQLVCGDCAHFTHCRSLFGCGKKSIKCDWFPRRFRMPETVLL